jgi:hypothetical protein
VISKVPVSELPAAAAGASVGATRGLLAAAAIGVASAIVRSKSGSMRTAPARGRRLLLERLERSQLWTATLQREAGGPEHEREARKQPTARCD